MHSFFFVSTYICKNLTKRLGNVIVQNNHTMKNTRITTFREIGASTGFNKLFKFYKFYFKEEWSAIVVMILFICLGCLGMKSKWLKTDFAIGQVLSAIILAGGFFSFVAIFIKPIFNFIIMPFVRKANNINIIAIKLTIGSLLGIALLSMPYGYYQLMRIVVVFLFGWLSYVEWEQKRRVPAFICAICVIIFQPLYKLAFLKSDWKKIDAACVLLLVVWIIFDLINQFRKNKRKVLNT